MNVSNDLVLVRPYMTSVGHNGEIVVIHPQYSTRNYGLFVESPMNRESQNTHISEVGMCISKNGWLGDITVALFDGKYIFIDGTHRAKWLMQKGHLIVFTLKLVDSELELLRLMIDANNVNKSWSLMRYVNSNAARTSGGESYKELVNVVANMPYMPVACAAAIFANISVTLAKSTIKKGTYYVPNVPEGKYNLNLVDTFFVESTLGLNSRSIEGLISVIRCMTITEFRTKHKAFALAVKTRLNSGVSNLLTSSMGAKEYENLLTMILHSMK